MRHISFIIGKEIRHILRDSRSLTIAIVMPLMMTFLYGYAINLDIKNIKIAILDYDHSPESRELANTFYNSGYFLPPAKPTDIMDPDRMFKSGAANAILTIKPGFGKALVKMENYELGLLVDGSDANLAAAATSYSNIILNKFLERKYLSDLAFAQVALSSEVLYNPDLKSSHFFVPGLIAVILMMISALLTSITIAREKETGTMEQLLTTPISSAEVIIGKVVPYIILALLDGVLVLLAALLIFNVPFAGSILLMLFFGIIYIIAALSLGILISTLVPTQQLAMMTAQLVTLLPSVMLSGYIFEIKNMPKFLQLVSTLLPARYFISIIRGIMLKGSDISTLWAQAIPLAILTLVLLGIAAKKFRMKIG